MFHDTNQDDTVHTMVVVLNEECQWGLTESDQERYTQNLRHFISPLCSEPQMRRICMYYHADGELVEALLNRDHVGHSDMWLKWMDLVPQILTRNGLNWSSDQAVGREDLAQVAITELYRSLLQFRFQCSFNTWANAVVMRSVRRFLRDTQAIKRAQRPDSLTELAEVEVPASTTDQPEAHAEAAVLRDLVNITLGLESDSRLGDVFRLWAIADQSSETIATRFQLHPSRIRSLLQQARLVLSSNPSIQHWRRSGSDISPL